MQQKRGARKVDQRNKYDVVFAWTNAEAGLTFGQLRQEDGAGDRKNLNRIFGKAKLKLEVNGETEQAEINETEEN